MLQEWHMDLMDLFFIRTGKGGTLNPVMPWVAFKNMNDDDLKAIYSYLRTIPASRHFVNNQLPFTFCKICEQNHGLGEQNKREKPTGIKLNPDIRPVCGSLLERRTQRRIGEGFKWLDPFYFIHSTKFQQIGMRRILTSENF